MGTNLQEEKASKKEKINLLGSTKQNKILYNTKSTCWKLARYYFKKISNTDKEK
jgi:hypothetical protein